MKAALNPAPVATTAESVSEFTHRVRTLLEGGIRPGWVRGEVSNLRAQSSGHSYFSLKDAGAQLSCVLFRGDAARQTVPLRDGLQVVVFGEISVYEQRGQYQLIVRAVVEDGLGRLQREFEALKKRLSDEGIFDGGRKRALPFLPRTVGFITSPTGAALQDFLRILRRRRWRGRVIVLPARVQGDGAAAEIIAMLALAQQLAIFDLLVVGRGGGSLEDLWAFNEEPLVRAIAASAIPVISAVGHEIDFTLADFAADIRAETPSAAAELITSHFVECAERAARLQLALTTAATRGAREARERVNHARARLRLLSPGNLVERGHLRVDDLANRLGSGLSRVVQEKRARMADIRFKLVRHSPQVRLQIERGKLESLKKRLAAASPASVLNRGFVIVRDEKGKPVSRRKGLKPGQPLTTQFADGDWKVRSVQDTDPTSPIRSPKL